MKMLKKMAALLLAGVMAMALLTACGDEAPSKSFAQQTEETVFSFYSKALGVEKNDADMKKLAEKTLGYIDEDGVVTIHEDMADSGKPVNGKITITVAMPLPAPNTQVSLNAKTYKAFEITPENLSQIQNAMGSVEAVKKLDGVTINKFGVAAKTINNKTYVAYAMEYTYIIPNQSAQ